MSASDLVDTSGGTPSVNFGKWAARLFGVTVFGWILGVIQLILTWGAGINDTLEAFATFLIYDVVGFACFEPAIAGLFPNGAPRCRGIIGILDANLGVAFQQNISWLQSTFGPFAQLAAAIEIALLLVLLVIVVKAIWRGMF